MSVAPGSMDQDIQSVAIKQAGIEMALWAALRAIFETSPEAATFLRQSGPSCSIPHPGKMRRQAKQ